MAPPSPLKVVHVGCGSMAKTWLRHAAAHPDLEIVGLVDLNLEAARKLGTEFAPRAETGTDLASLLEKTRPDVVFNCTVPAAHYEVTTTALGAGCHVLSEKPLAASLDEGLTLAAAARKAERLVAVVQNRRYTRAIRHVRSLLASGLIGEVTEVAVDFYLGAHFGGFRETMDHVLLIDMAIHPFDMARFVTAQDPLAVTCHEWNPPGSWYRHGANAHAFFEMTGGGVFSYRGSWCAEGHPTTWGGSWRIVGTRGTLAWNSDEQGQSDSIVVESVVKPNGFTSLLERRALPAPACPGWDNGHASLIAEFAACVRTGRTPPTHAADNLKSLAMVFGAVESAERGQRVLLGDPSLCPTT